jgi:hypothetical protein
VAGELAVATLLAGPTAYAVTSIGHSTTGSMPSAGPTISQGGPGGFGGRFGGGGGFPGGGPSAGGGGGAQGGDAEKSLVNYLLAHRGSAEYLVAVQGAGNAEPLILATGKPVIAMRGFTGSDNAPTLNQLEALVKAGKLKYVLLNENGGGAGGPGGGARLSAVTNWVESHGAEVSYGNTSSGTLYRL